MRPDASELPNYDKILPVALTEGIEALPAKCSLTPGALRGAPTTPRSLPFANRGSGPVAVPRDAAGIPVKPMLAHPTKSISEILDRFEGMTFTCEFKYDGERNQIHRLENGQVLVYSRNSENLTDKYPDLLDRLKAVRCLCTVLRIYAGCADNGSGAHRLDTSVAQAAKPGVQSFILDCEAVAWDREERHILPFQVLSTRKRKVRLARGQDANMGHPPPDHCRLSAISLGDSHGCRRWPPAM